jgi:hypothetical protein
MLLKSENDTVLLINAKQEGDRKLVCGLVYFTPTQATSAIVRSPDNALVYSIKLPVEVKNLAVPMTGVNVSLSAQKLSA